MRKQINHERIIQYIQQEKRDADIIREFNMNKAYYYRLKQRWKLEGKIEGKPNE
ncbi:hypothetical protein [Vibrio harveyi]|uniref:hypothetical protein n=1 Tax=Vibrio harveyi TaxID=669 RepID=UPI0035E62874